MSADLTPYLNLVTSEYADQPDFIAFISIFLQGMADAKAVAASMPGLFDLDVAVGDQLDKTGQWIGQSRELLEPLTGVYFSWGTAGVGWGEGTWKGPFDPSSGLVSLPDDSYRVLLKAVVAANNWDGTIPGAYAAYNLLTDALGGQILIFDNGDMTMTIGYVGTSLNAVVLAMLVNGLLDLKPATVAVTGYVTPSIPMTPFFGFGLENGAISGFGVGAWAETL